MYLVTLKLYRTAQIKITLTIEIITCYFPLVKSVVFGILILMLVMKRHIPSSCFAEVAFVSTQRWRGAIGCGRCQVAQWFWLSVRLLPAGERPIILEEKVNHPPAISCRT